MKKLRTVLVIDQSGSMGENGKWRAVLAGLNQIARENANLDGLMLRVFFQVNRNVDKSFLPFTSAAERIPGRPDGCTAFFDAGRRGLDYLMEELESFPEGDRPIGQLMMMSDGLDNRSGAHSQANFARNIKLLLKEYCPDGNYQQSGLMIVYWGFGDGSQADRSRHFEIAKNLNIPECWTRYSFGNEREVKIASEAISRAIQESGTEGNTVLF